MARDPLPCHDCGRLTRYNEAGLAMDMPGVTDGPQLWCRGCRPPAGDPAETIALFESFMFPPQEPGDTPGADPWA